MYETIMWMPWLFNILEAWYKKNWTLVFVLYNDVSNGSINNQEYKRFLIDAVTIKISMTEYHHWKKKSGLWFILLKHSSLHVRGEMSVVNLVTFLFSFIWRT